MVRLNRRDSCGENIRRRKRICRCAREHNLIVDIFEMRRRHSILFPRLRGQEQFVQIHPPSFSRRLRIDEDCSIRANRNFPALRQHDLRTEFDLHFRGSYPEPQHQGLKSERRDDFAAILKKQRHVKRIRRPQAGS